MTEEAENTAVFSALLAIRILYCVSVKRKGDGRDFRGGKKVTFLLTKGWFGII